MYKWLYPYAEYVSALSFIMHASQEMFRQNPRVHYDIIVIAE